MIKVEFQRLDSETYRAFGGKHEAKIYRAHCQGCGGLD